MAHEAGKGDKRRPTDTKAFESNFDTIYRDNKPIRGSFIWCNVAQKLVSKDEYYANKQESSAPMIMNDIEPYKSMATGEMITSRSTHRQHLKQHGLIEIGNEKIKEPKPVEINNQDRKQYIADIVYNRRGK